MALRRVWIVAVVFVVAATSVEAATLTVIVTEACALCCQVLALKC